MKIFKNEKNQVAVTFNEAEAYLLLETLEFTDAHIVYEENSELAEFVSKFLTKLFPKD